MSQYQTIRQVLQKNPNQKYKLLARKFFKNDSGEPFELTDGQAEIFRIVYEEAITRGTIRTITQYGKSEVVSMAILLVAVERKEKILIVAPSEKQAGIIMGNVIKHVFDHELITNMMIHEGSLERLKQERSKNRITFRDGSEIFILTGDVSTVSKEGKALMGFGATIVIADESSLIPDIIFSKILRMVGGVPDGKLVQLGNPFEKNHFAKAFNQPRYVKLIIKKEQALAEGRITQEFLDEAREEMTELEFTIFYDCEFPEGGANDALIPWDWIEKAIGQALESSESKFAGLDVARFGRDKSIYLLREGGTVTRMEQFEKLDTMQLAGWMARRLDEDSPELTAVDVIGIGAGVVDRLIELGYEIEGVNVGESADEENKGRYLNKRAWFYFHLREQFRPDEVTKKSAISIPNDPELIKELQEIRYKIASDKRIRIEEKEEMKKRLGRSPDKADALMLAFAPVESTRTSLSIL